MGVIAKYIEQLQRASDAEQTRNILVVVKRNEAIILDLNEAQMFKGIDGDFLPIYPPYASPSYAYFKLSLNPLGVVDLKLTGSFYRNRFVVADKFPVYIDDRDSKTPMLLEKYGSAVLQLTQDSKDKVAEQDKEEIIDYYRKVFILQ